MFSVNIILRYTLLQLPPLLIFLMLLSISGNHKFISDTIIIVLMVIWIVKDIIFYPFVWRSYDPATQHIRDKLIGMYGVAKENLEPAGYVKVRGELWKAQIKGDGQIINAGESVHVIGIDGLVLLVERTHN